MGKKQILQAIITTMQQELPFPVIERDLKLPIDSGQMVTICGVRRCGKSSMMKIVANRLMEKGLDRKRILWINFDDERLDGMTPNELDEVLQGYREMFPDIPLSSVYMFFDEIQNIDKWELFVLRVYKTYCRNIYISGSNSKMLSSQLSTALRGWPLEYEAFPLSFSEYLRFQNIEASIYDESGRALLTSMVKKYIHSSAFPEVVLMTEKSLKVRKVQGYFNTMLFRDMIERYGLTSPDTTRYFLKRMMANLSKPTSVNAIYNDLKSQGRKVDKNKMYDVADQACECFMFYKVARWSRSLVKEHSRLPKYYFIDNGMRNSILMPQTGDDGKLLENAVYLQLRRHLSPSQKITYYQDTFECDFAIQNEEYTTLLIQVCWTLDNDETKLREFRGLKFASEASGCDNCIVITIDEEFYHNYEGLLIKVRPIWKWLLQNPFE